MSGFLGTNFFTNSFSAGFEVFACRFDSSDTSEMARTIGTPTNVDKWTCSWWQKRTTAGFFDISFAKGMSLKDGAATLTVFTANIFISHFKNNSLFQDSKKEKIILCGGGRKNKTLIERIKRDSHNKLKFETTDDYKVDGDFVESQAFAFLAIRSFYKLPISFPNTTGCKLPSTGGVLVKNF